jgi:hypothetical protein
MLGNEFDWYMQFGTGHGNNVFREHQLCMSEDQQILCHGIVVFYQVYKTYCEWT